MPVEASDDLAGNDTRNSGQPTLDDTLQPPPGDRSGERQDEEEADDVGQESGSQQQGAADEYQCRVGQLTPAHPAGVQRHPQAAPGPEPLALDQIGAQRRLHQQQGNGLPAADDPAHRDDQRDLGNRDDQQRHEDIPPPPRAPTSVTGQPLSRCHRGSLRRSDLSWPSRYRAPQAVMLRNDSPTIPWLILESPISRSTKVIGTSTTVSPRRTARHTRSTWKQ